jgi:chorismate mutase/prephenate dehydrogenase
VDDLESLRGRIQEIDEQLVRLVAERIETARAVGRAKLAAGIPLRDFDVERQVLDRAAESASGHGIGPDAVRQVMQILIGAARDEQERVSYSGYTGAAEHIAVVGGLGKMGSWLVGFLENQGHRVRVLDKDDDVMGGVGGTSIAFLSTPQEAMPALIEGLAESGYRGIVCDIASLKNHLRPAVEHAVASGMAVTSIHPMFGPTVRTLSDRVICVCDCGDPEATSRVAGLFSDTAVTLVPLEFEEHDRIVSYVLGLSHLLNLVFAEVLAQGHVPYGDLDRIGSTTFHAQMTTTRTVVDEDPDLYFAIQRLNPFSSELYETVRDRLTEFTEIVERDDRASFTEIMERSRRWLEGA